MHASLSSKIEILLLITLAILLFGMLVPAIWSVIEIVKINVKGIRLGTYLRDKNYALWAQLTSIGNWGPGMRNPVRGLQFLLDRNPSGDCFVDDCKARLRRHWCRLLIGLCIAGMFLIVFACLAATYVALDALQK